MLSMLGNHLDALYLSVYSQLSDDMALLMAQWKTEAQQSGDEMRELMAIPYVPGGVLYVRPYGRGRYQYVLENASFYMAFTTWKNLPTVDFQFKAETLYEYDLAGLEAIAHRVLSFFLGESEYKVKVSRVDVAADFQLPGFEMPDIADCIKRARHWKLDGHGEDITAMTFGERTGALQAQLYNKSLELDVSEKAWMRDVWRASGNYDPLEPAYRAEVRFYREGLRAFEVDTFAELRERLGDLVEYSVSPEAGSWLRVNDPADRYLKDRSARRAAGWWREVAGGLMRDFPGQARKRRGYDCRPSFYRQIQLAGAHLASAAAIARLAKTGQGMGADLYHASLDPAEFGREVGRMYADRLRQHRRATWAEKVNEKTAKLRLVAW